MPIPITLTSGAYSAKGYISSAQRCVNLYPEKNPDDVKPGMPFTHYPRPGLIKVASPPVPGPGRCLYGANNANGSLFAVIGQTVYYIDRDHVFYQIGQLQAPATTPASMADNGKAILLVDNSANGYQIQLVATADQPNQQMTQIGDPNFTGATRVDFLDGFLIFNIPGTNQWGSTLANQIAFNPLYVGIKTAWPDPVLTVCSIEREAYIFGPKKSEPWYNAGTVPFPFQLLSGVIVEHGIAAPYSVAKADTNVFWLSQSPEGDRMVMRGGNQNVAQRVSTHAIEAEFKKYARVGDAIGAMYQIEGHLFYKLHFPTADKTWGYDLATNQWHEDNWIDQNGVLHRARNTFCAFAYGKNYGLDWSTGDLYVIDPNTYTDAGNPIACIRGFPHVVNSLDYLSIARFVVDFQTGGIPGTGEQVQFLSPFSSGFSSGFGPMTQVEQPMIYVRCSKDGGASFGNWRTKGLTSAGHYRSLMRFPSWGQARDFVFEVGWSAPMQAALNGAFIEPMGSAA